MVAVLDLYTLNRVSPRILRMLKDADIPGDQRDHEWMGWRIQQAAEKLTERYPAEFGQDLLLSGLALELNRDLSVVKDLEDWNFPEGWLSAVPVLLQCGFPSGSWRLVEAGVLRYETAAKDIRYGWRLELDQLSELTDGSYELGEGLLLGVLTEGLAGVTHSREKDSRISVVSSNRENARGWVRLIREGLSSTCSGEVPLVVAL